MIYYSIMNNYSNIKYKYIWITELALLTKKPRAASIYAVGEVKIAG